METDRYGARRRARRARDERLMRAHRSGKQPEAGPVAGDEGVEHRLLGLHLGEAALEPPAAGDAGADEREPGEAPGPLALGDARELERGAGEAGLPGGLDVFE